jgi:cytochrome c oxidase subunit 2
MVVAIVLVLIVVGSVAFHFLSPWWWTPVASNWGTIDDTILITFWITGAVFAAVVLFAAYCLWKFRHREGHKADYEPENKKLENWLMGLTAIGVAAMLAPGLFVWSHFINVPAEASEAEVVGQQWQWAFRLPGADGKLGLVDTKLIAADNPYGIHPDDPNGQDDVLIEADYLHLPIDKPVKMLLRSTDVLHDFYVAEFRAKMDMIPGAVTYFWFTPTRTGQFEVLCAELCGTGHPYMRGGVVVDTQEDYDAWLASQSTYAQLYAPEVLETAQLR